MVIHVDEAVAAGVQLDALLDAAGVQPGQKYTVSPAQSALIDKINTAKTQARALVEAAH